MSAVLELDGVSKRYPRRDRLGREVSAVVAVADVDLAVEPGEIVGLVGESGAGKSTLARLVLGLERPDAGSVRLGGTDLATLGARRVRRARREMHLVMQDPYQSLHPGMRVGTLVAEPLAVAGVDRAERRARAVAALEEVGLGPGDTYASRFPHELSGGQRQRVAMARALVGRPKLVLADEPTSMLDASLRSGILELLLSMRDRLGSAFLFITHDLALARYVSDRIAVMRGGRIVECDETDRVILHPQHPYTEALLLASEGIVPDEAVTPEEEPDGATRA